MATKVKHVSVSFFAKVGNGKSSSANTLLQAWGYEGLAFEARRQREIVTTDVQTVEQEFKDPEAPSKSAEGDGDQRDGTHSESDSEADDREESTSIILRVTDQPGLMDSCGYATDVENMRRTALTGEHQNGYHVLFVVQKITDRLDAGEQAILRIVRRFYGDVACRHTVLLLTHSDVLDTPEEIRRMTQEAREDVEKEIGAMISGAIAINNHPSRSDSTGKDRIKAGRAMIFAIHEVVCSMSGSEPFKPAEVDYETVVKYVNEEVERNPSINKDSILAAVLRFAPVVDRRKLCVIL